MAKAVERGVVAGGELAHPGVVEPIEVAARHDRVADPAQAHCAVAALQEFAYQVQLALERRARAAARAHRAGGGGGGGGGGRRRLPRLRLLEVTHLVVESEECSTLGAALGST